MAQLNFKNKKVIISAGASGIGWATAKIFLSKGANVYLCDINIKNINKVKKHPLNNKRLFIYECDASDEYDVESFFDKIRKKTKKIDALINNVGVAGPTGTIEKLNSEDWERTLKVNEDSFLDEFLPKDCLTPATVEVVDKSGNVKGYITDKELSVALTKTHSNGVVKS